MQAVSLGRAVNLLELNKKGGSTMNSRDVFEVIYEALLLYIDDISAIDDVFADDGNLVVSLIDGDKYQLSIAHRID